MILVSSIGKFRIWTGQPLLALVRLEAEAADLMDQCEVRQGIIVTSQKPVVILRSTSGDRSELQPDYLPENLPPRVVALDTTSIPTGAYEVGISLMSKEVWVPENVWILDRKVYKSLLIEESKEEFEKYPSISSTSELGDIFRHVIFSTWPELQINITPSFSSQLPIPTATVEWITRTILDTLHYVSVFGLRNPSGFVAISEKHVEVGVQANLEYPPPASVIRSLHDRECSDLHLLNASKDFEDFGVDLSIEHSQARIAIRQSRAQPVLV